MTFEVKRSEWIRGGEGRSALFWSKNEHPNFPDRKRCCLGFFANACGIPDSVLEGFPTPHRYLHQGPWEPISREWDALTMTEIGEYRMNTTLCCDLMACNDNRSITDDAREAELTKLFSELGHEVVFVD